MSIERLHGQAEKLSFKLNYHRLWLQLDHYNSKKWSDGVSFSANVEHSSIPWTELWFVHVLSHLANSWSCIDLKHAHNRFKHRRSSSHIPRWEWYRPVRSIHPNSNGNVPTNLRRCPSWSYSQSVYLVDNWSAYHCLRRCLLCDWEYASRSSYRRLYPDSRVYTWPPLYLIRYWHSINEGRARLRCNRTLYTHLDRW